MSDTFVAVAGDDAGLSAASEGVHEDPALDVVGSETGEWVSCAARRLPDDVSGEVEDVADLDGRRAAKRIDAIATALGAEMTPTERGDADLAYAPSFSHVGAPILAAANVLDGELAGR